VLEAFDQPHVRASSGRGGDDVLRETAESLVDAAMS